jgi:hypothetical protein
MYYIDATTFTAATVVCTDPELLTPAPDGYYSINGLVRQQLNGVLQFPVVCPDCKGYEKPVEGELLLDLYPGAAAAYSLDQLNTSYSGAAIRVRRASDSTEQDIGFTEEFTLDTAALEAFCTGTNGFVAVWYDQSGEGNNAAQATTANQPKIYDAATGVQLENTLPAPTYNGTSMYLDTPAISALNTDVQSSFVVATAASTSATLEVIWRSRYTSGALSLSSETTGLFKSSLGVVVGFHARNSGGTYIGTSNSLDTNQKLYSSFWNSSDVISSNVNGTAFSTNNMSGATAVPSGHVLTRIGATSANPGNYWAGTIQAFIIYAADKSADRTAIEANINSRYNIYWDGTVTSLLDDYQGAAAAYALRALNSLYTGPLVRVRRESDNAERDIRALYNGELNTSSLSSFSAGTNAYVATWYDQSGNAKDATQTTTSLQPKIYDASTGINLKNAVAALNFDGNDDYLQTTYDNANNYTAFWVQVPVSDVGGQVIGRGDLSARHVAGWSGSNAFLYRGGSASIQATDAAAQYLGYALSRPNSADCRVGYNGSTGTTSTLIGTATLENMVIGAERASSSLYGNSDIQAVIIYDADKSADRAAIESALNSRYNIYWDGTVTSLLDDYQGAAAAYALRALNSLYTGPLVRVRRESDNAERDVRALYNGELDTSSLSSFSAGTNAYVAVWYDQSGNANNASQATTANQPKIYDASTGALVNSSAIPNAFFDQTHVLDSSFSASTSAMSLFAITTWNGGRKALFILGRTNIFELRQWNVQDYYLFYGDGATEQVLTGGTTLQGYQLISTFKSSGNISTFVNSSADKTATGALDGAGVMKLGGPAQLSGTAYISAMIFYNADKSADRAGIESALNGYFNIY